MKQLGADDIGKVHTTRLKERILAHFPDMQTHKVGRDVLMLFDDVGIAIRRAVKEDWDGLGVQLVRTASTVLIDKKYWQ